MGFFDSLMQNPSGSGIYGQTKRNPSDDIGYVNTLRKRQMDDQYNQAIRMKSIPDTGGVAGGPVRQNRMNTIYGNAPFFDAGAGNTPSQGLNNANPSMNTVFKDDPDRITPQQSMAFGLKREDLANDRAGIALKAKLGDERMGLDKQKHDLDVNKNQNIYDTKQADLERKRDEADRRLKIAEDTLNARKGDSEATAKYHQAQIDAMNARHAADLAHRDRQLEDLNKFRDDTLAERARTREQNSTSTTFGEDFGDDGKPKKVTTKKGSQSDPNDPLDLRKLLK